MNNIATTKQAATKLGLSSSRVRQLIRAGKLNATQLDSGVWIIDQEELNNFSFVIRKPGRPKKNESS
tara:strand:- start:670 stop:870 length:201 start_codon:yes stop_codon:yes gene_type:complete